MRILVTSKPVSQSSDRPSFSPSLKTLENYNISTDGIRSRSLAIQRELRYSAPCMAGDQADL